MGCQASQEVGAVLEYHSRGPNPDGFQDSVSENGVYTFRVDAANSWQLDGTRNCSYLYALPPLFSTVSTINIAVCARIDVKDPSELVSAKICLVLVDGQGGTVASATVLDEWNTVETVVQTFIASDEVVQRAAPGYRYRLALLSEGKAAVRCAVRSFQINVVSGRERTAPIKPPFEESLVPDTGVYVLNCPRPWCWGTTQSRQVNWVSTPVLTSGCSQIVVSFVIDLDCPSDPAKASSLFVEASLDLLLVRDGKVVAYDSILRVTRQGVEMARKRELQHSIDQTSRRGALRLLRSCSAGDKMVLVRKVDCDPFCRFLVTKFRLEVHPIKPGTPCTNPQRVIKYVFLAEMPEGLSDAEIALECDESVYQDENGGSFAPIGYVPPDGRFGFGGYGGSAPR